MSATRPPLPFGLLLKGHRRAARLSQAELAERMGYSASYISMLERGQRVTLPGVVTLLAEALDLAPADVAHLVAANRRAAHHAQQTAAYATPWTLGPAMPPLVGREPERALIERLLASEGPPVLLLAGEPGIGKTRLLREAAQGARQQKWCVLEGGCTRRGGQEPFAPLVEALASRLRDQPEDQVRRELDGCAWLARLVPELAEMGLVPAPRWTVAPEQERRLMFVAAQRFLARVAGEAGTLLVLDDLQWAGADSFELLATLVATDVRHGASAPLRVVGAYRGTEVEAAHPLTTLLADLSREALVTRAPLGPMADAEATKLFGSLSDGEQGKHTAAADIASEIVRRCAGIPFYLVSYARALRAGALSVTGPSGRDSGLPWEAAESIRVRIAALPLSARELLRVAAVCGRVSARSVLLAAVATATGQSRQETLVLLEQACAARLLLEKGETVYAFAHDLIRETVLAELGAARRALLHEQVAAALEREPGELRLAELADHYARSEAHEQAVIYLERAGDQALARHANAEAAGFYRELLARLEALGRTSQGAWVREKVGGVLTIGGKNDAALEVLEPAVAIFRASGDREGLLRVTAMIGRIEQSCDRYAEALARIEPLLDAYQDDSPSPGLVELHLVVAMNHMHSGRRADHQRAAERAAELARALGDVRLLMEAEVQRGMAQWMAAEYDEALATWERVIQRAELLGELGVLSEALSFAAYTHDHRGQHEEATRCRERALVAAEQADDLPTMIGILSNQGLVAFLLGDWEQARVVYRRAAGLIGEMPRSRHAIALLVNLSELELAEGRWEAAMRHLEEASAQAEAIAVPELVAGPAAVLAIRDLLAGRPDVALARLQTVLATDGVALSDDCDLGPPIVWAYLDSGDEARAVALAAQAEERARAQQDPLALANALWARALVARRQRRWAEAIAALEEAIALCTGTAMPSRYPYAEARALWLYGQVEAGRGQPERARERYEQALAILNRLGERLYAEHVERALAALSAARVR